MTANNPPCPLCGSANVHKRGTEPRSDGRHRKYICLDCGHVWASKEPITGDVVDHRRRR